MHILSFLNVNQIALRAKLGFERAIRTNRTSKVFATFDHLREKYEKFPTEKIGAQLSQLMGTTTSYEIVQSAMNGEFDNDYYLGNYADVSSATDNGYAHYSLFGWKEGRSPNPFFDCGFYRSCNPNMASSEFPLAHFVAAGKAIGAPTNPISDRFWFEGFIPTESEWNALRPAKIEADTEAVVVIPVFKGLQETLTAIYQALASRGDDRYCVLVLNDNSPDDAINRMLSKLADLGLFVYHASVINRGFVQTCNFAIEKFGENRDVVLLNSDAYVFPGWYSRLKKHASDERVATVTPLSNNATICSYPLTNRDNSLALECTPLQLDSMARTANAGLAIEAPTGVGFCLYIKRDAIAQIGLLDADAFKMGYGEENDFCMRALNKGYKNLVAGDVFVFHKGSVSFSTTKKENMRKGEVALERKHPNYMSLVRAHAAADPERYLRRRLDLERLANSLIGCTIFISHKLGGGVETYLRALRGSLKADKKPYVTLRVHDRHQVTIDTDGKLFLPNLADIDLRTESDLLISIVCRLAPEVLHVNSLAGLDWYWHRQLLTMIKASGVPYIYICHDYSPISHHSSLLRPDKVYIPNPTINERRAWLTMIDGECIDACHPDERLTSYGEFLATASRVEIPSQTAKTLLQREFPLVNFKLVPHTDHLPDVPMAQRQKVGGTTRIAVIGAISVHKGSDVIAALAADAKLRSLPLEYTIVGYSNNDNYLRSLDVTITGRYRDEQDALNIISKLKPDLVFIPSICAETYCYSLSFAIKLRIPPVVFNIGAQAERVSPLKWGTILPIELAYSPRQLSDALSDLDVDKLWGSRV